MAISKIALREVLQDQRRMFSALTRGVSRTLLVEMQALRATPQVVVITGLRRSGKSTLLAQLGDSLGEQSFYYCNFEDERLGDFDLNSFALLEEVLLELYGARNIFLLDEVQVVEGWERFVRRAQDSGVKFFITGSNASLPSKEFGSKLTGRHHSLDLFPFSFEEFLRFRGVSLDVMSGAQIRATLARLFQEFLAQGGIPLALQYPESSILSELYRDVIYRDIVVRYKLDSEKPVKKLAFYLFNNPATLQSYSKLKQLIQVGSITTIKNYLQYLESAWLCFELELYDMSVKRQQLSPKKILCIDSGFISKLAIAAQSKQGRIFENVIFLELRRKYSEIYYYLTAKDEEVDFCIPRAGLFVQVCLDLSGVETRHREIKSLEGALAENPEYRGVIITLDNDNEAEISNPKIKILTAGECFRYPKFEW